MWKIEGKITDDDVEHIPNEGRAFDPNSFLTAYADWPLEEVAEDLAHRVALEMLTKKEATDVYLLFATHRKILQGMGEKVAKATTHVSAEV